MGKYTDLIAKLKKADGSDRQLDLEIGRLWPGKPPFSLSVEQQRGGKPPVYRFTASVDAANALVAAVFPESYTVSETHGGRIISATLITNARGYDYSGGYRIETAPLLIVLLYALEAQS